MVNLVHVRVYQVNVDMFCQFNDAASLLIVNVFRSSFIKKCALNGM